MIDLTKRIKQYIHSSYENTKTENTMYDNEYNRFPISKGNGKVRWITAPSDELKAKQTEFLNDVLYSQMPHKCATGFGPGLSIVDNARPHVNKNKVLNIDIKDFFGSTKAESVRSVLSDIYALKGSDLDDKVALCTWRGELPQGSPCSPHIANMVLYKFDQWLLGECQKEDLSYTRYADDITISGRFIPKGLVSRIRKRLRSFGYRLAEHKIHINEQNRRQTVTGLVVNKKVQLPRALRKWIRAVLHSGATQGLETMLERSDKDFEQIQGYIGLQALYHKSLATSQLKALKEIS